LTLANVQRRECALLVHLHQSFAHKLERRREARGEHRRRERRFHHVRDQIFIEPRPIGRLADQPLERFACLGQRPHRALGEPHMRERAALALLGVGREQIVERRGPLWPLDVGDRLRLAAPEHVAIELGAIHQALGEPANGF